jgi:hypothetical protein
VFEEVEIAKLALRSHLPKVRYLRRRMQEVELLAQHGQSIELRRHAFTSCVRLNAS